MEWEGRQCTSVGKSNVCPTAHHGSTTAPSLHSPAGTDRGFTFSHPNGSDVQRVLSTTSDMGIVSQGAGSPSGTHQSCTGWGRRRGYGDGYGDGDGCGSCVPGKLCCVLRCTSLRTHEVNRTAVAQQTRRCTYRLPPTHWGAERSAQASLCEGLQRDTSASRTALSSPGWCTPAATGWDPTRPVAATMKQHACMYDCCKHSEARGQGSRDPLERVPCYTLGGPT